MEIGDRIKKLRIEVHMSQAELASNIGVSSGNVGDWERGRAKPGSDALKALVKFFNVSADWLLLGESDEIPRKCNSNESENNNYELIQMIVKEKELPIDTSLLIKFYNEMTNDGKRELLNNASELWAKNKSTTDNLSNSEEGSKEHGEEAATSETA